MPRAKPVPADAPMEPLWLLKSLPYRDYRMTNWWRRRRDAYIATVTRGYGDGRFEFRFCEICGVGNPNRAGITLHFHVHHITYKRLGQEHDDDLRLLCSPCHNLVHFPDSHAARHWAALDGNVAKGVALRAKALDPHVDSFYPHELESEVV